MHCAAIAMLYKAIQHNAMRGGEGGGGKVDTSKIRATK